MKCKIGIRPIIDGRRGGIRESLEEVCMNMARAAAALIESECFHPDGTNVECVISDTTIGGYAEAAACAEKFAKENVVGTLSVTPCWCYGTETMDTDPMTVKAVWGLNATERPGAVYLAAVMAAHAQLGLPAFAIYGKDVQAMSDTSVPEEVKNKILAFAKCAIAVGEMRNKAYVNIGGVAMGIMGSYCDVNFFKDYLGLRAEFVDMSEITRRMDLEIYDKEEFERAIKWVRNNCREGFDKNRPEKKKSRSEKDADWEYVVKMTMIIRDIVKGNPKLKEIGREEESNGHNGILGGFQGQRQWTDYMPNGDFAEALLNTNFDWNGKRPPLTFATENDGLNGVSMLFGTLLTGIPSVFADVRTFWSPEALAKETGWKPEGASANGFIHLINSGAASLDGTGAAVDTGGCHVMKKWWEVSDKDIENCLKATEFCPADRDYFRGGGYSSKFFTAYEMPVTLIRLNIVKGLGPVLQIAEGTTCVPPEEVTEKIWKRTDYTWPTTFFAPRLTGSGSFSSVYKMMSDWGSNHGAFAYGHIGSELITLASMLRIPVSLHNVPEDKIFRPHSFSYFGTSDKEGADYRACAAYGALYK